MVAHQRQREDLQVEEEQITFNEQKLNVIAISTTVQN